MLKRAHLRLKTLFWTNSCPLLKTLRSGVPRVKMTKHADLGLKTLFCTNWCTYKKSLKTGAPSAKMRKRADLGRKTLSWTNWCPLLKIAKKWSSQCENVKTCWSPAENAVLNKLMPFAENAKKWCAQCENDKTCWSRAENAVLYKLLLFAKKKMKSVASSAKMLKRADLGLKTLFWTNSCTLLKRVKKWCTQCKNESTCWSKANNAVLDKLVHFAENRLKVVRPVRKWGNVLISGRKHCYEQTRALCWNSLISSVHSAG